jgi:hypothetical protein
MKKEIIIAIVIGFILGLIITFGVYTANRALKAQKKPTSNLPPVEEATPEPLPTTTLEISEPENNIVVKNNEITVSGTTAPKTPVAIIAEEFQGFAFSDDDGVFSLDVPLVGGANEIRVVSVPKEGEKQEKILTIVFTTAEI